tara:strand:+ start:5727 stop:6254 length:528 start_codon:yes stop_codon:yes gene_type:complete
MNWEDILKVQVLDNKQRVKMGNIPIPTQDDNECLKRLGIFLEKLQNLFDKYPSSNNESLYKIDILDMSEESACELLKELNRSVDNMNTNHDWWDEYYSTGRAVSGKTTLHISIRNSDESGLEVTSEEGNRVQFQIYYTGEWMDGSHPASFGGIWHEFMYNLEDVEEELKKLFREA